ncbi:hypothetical protein HDV05_000185 [Chytridiales sp. JEL 0842]|nr:hypothetical protein HDV05_000185 [Chytridiales sp. JEL 0842]
MTTIHHTSKLPTHTAPLHRRNLWLGIPPEIRTRILSLSDALTQFLNKHGLYHPSYLSTRKKQLQRKLWNNIWESALDSGWNGNLNTLPGSFDPIDYTDWCRLVRTKELYTRISTLPITNRSSVLESIAMRHCWLEHLPCDILDQRMSYIYRAAYEGHLAFLLHMNNIKPLTDDFIWNLLANALATQARTEDIKFLLAARPDCIDANTVDQAAASGDLKLFQYLFAKVGSCTTSAMDLAAASGNLDIVIFLHAHTVEGCTFKAMDYAATNGHLRIVQFLHTNRFEGCTTDAIDRAAANGHLKVVKYLFENRKEGCTIYAMEQAAANGHLEVLRYLDGRQIGGWSSRVMDKAAEAGHLDVVEWLHKYRSEGCTKNAMEGAAANMFLDVVHFLKGHGYGGSNGVNVKEEVAKHCGAAVSLDHSNQFCPALVM